MAPDGGICVSMGTYSSCYKTDAFAYSVPPVDPDEMAHKEPSHQDLHSLPFHFGFCFTHLFVTGYVQIQRWNRFKS